MLTMSESIWLIWDVAAAVVILACVRYCARQGLVRTVISFFSYFIAAAGARIFSPVAAQLLYDAIVKDAMVLFVSKKLGDTLATGQELVSQVLDSLPERLLPVTHRLSDGADYASMEAGQLVEELVDAALREPVLTILQSLCFLLIFSLVILLIRHVSRLFTGVYRIPVIGPINTFLGGLVGVLQAVLFLLVGALAARLLIFVSGGELIWLNESVMDDTYIWRVFYRIVG